VEFSFSGVSMAQGQAGFCHPVPGVSGLPAVRSRTCALNGTELALISANSRIQGGRDHWGQSTSRRRRSQILPNPSPRNGSRKRNTRPQFHGKPFSTEIAAWRRSVIRVAALPKTGTGGSPSTHGRTGRRTSPERAVRRPADRGSSQLEGAHDPTMPSLRRHNRINAKHLSDTGRCGSCKATLPPVSEPIEVDATEFTEITPRSQGLVDFWAEWCGPAGWLRRKSMSLRVRCLDGA